MKNLKNQRGFTLLLAALVASIVLALGAAIYSIAKKQVSLSSIGRDSQFAFYAADTLAECALYWDVRQNGFSTSSPPATVTCDGTASNVTAVSDTTIASNGSQSFVNAGTFTFTVPANYGTLTVAVSGPGGGGGGGARVGFGAGGIGGAGSPASSFNGNVIANSGTGGLGGATNGNNGASGQPGSATGGDTNQSGAGSLGGGGGNGSGSGGSTGAGGNGGNGGLATKQYTPSTLAPGSSITVVVGAGGNGGAAGGSGASTGFAGNAGRIDITWTGGTPVWHSTTFYFQSQPNGVCANIALTKGLNALNQVRTQIFANGFNVACSATTTSPRALQRSVQLNY